MQGTDAAPGWPTGSAGHPGPATVDGVRVVLVAEPEADPDGEPPAEQDRVVVYDAPVRASRVQARLLFRVGVVDESLADRGITQLTLRLAAAGLASAELAVDVGVGTTTSWVHLYGSGPAVTAGLAEVTAALADLDDDLLEETRERLAVEEEIGQLDSVVVPGAVGRFGARGPGLAGFRLSLRGTVLSELRTWSRRHLGAGNAVLWGEGLARSGLRLALHDGPAVPEPLFTSRLHEPTWSEGHGIALQLLVPRSWASRLAAAVLDAHLAETLRPFSVTRSSGFLPLDLRSALVVVRLVPLPGSSQQCVDGLVASLGLLADDLPVDLVARVLATSETGEMVDGAVALEVAEELVCGGEAGDAGSPRRVLDVTPAEVATVIGDGARTALLTGPVAPSGPGWAPPPPLVRPDLTGGTIYTSRRGAGVRLVVGPGGILLDAVVDAGTGAGWDDVALVRTDPAKTRATVVLTDGTSFEVRDGEWRGRGTSAVQEIVLRAGGRAPVHADPALRPADDGERRPLDRAGKHRVAVWVFAAGASALLALLSLTAVLGGSAPIAGAVLLVLFGAATVVLLRAARGRYRRGGPRRGGLVTRPEASTAADLLISGAGRGRLLVAAIALWTVPTVAIPVLFVSSHVFVWPIAFAYRFAYRTTLELRRRDRDRR